jgi:hypothetical protein
MAITSLPAVPQRSDPTNFATKADAFLAALPTFVSDANTLAANLNSIAAGGAYAIPYTYAATPTPVGQAAGGRLSFNSGGTATTANSIYADVKSSGGSTVTAILNDFNASSSTVKGVIRLVKVGDTTKWATFNVSAYVLNGGGLYGIATVTPVAQSSATPFNDGDSLVLLFQRTGDMGATGAAGQSGVLVFHAREEQAAGTTGAAGTSVTGGYRRVLNTVKTNQISGVALSGNQITGVPAGVYKVRARSPLHLNSAVMRKLALYNVTTSSYVAIGSPAFNFDYSGASDIYGEVSELMAVITLAGTTTLELRDLWSGASPAFWGRSGNQGQVEVYTEIMIEKIG